MLERARLILSQLDESVQLVRAVAAGRSGQLTVGFFPTATYEILPRVLRRYRERYPDIGLRFVELTTPEQPNALEQKHIDVALFLSPTVGRRGIVQETFHQEPLLVALSADHRLASREHINLRELRDEPFVFIPPRWGTGYHARVSNACQEAGFTPNVIEEVEQLHTMVSLVSAGLGVSIVAASVSRFQPPNVVFRSLDDPELYIEFGLAWRKEDLSPAVTAFCDTARSVSG
jgi:DNA-binding transcriptional LysR family regulator